MTHTTWIPGISSTKRPNGIALRNPRGDFFYSYLHLIDLWTLCDFRFLMRYNVRIMATRSSGSLAIKDATKRTTAKKAVVKKQSTKQAVQKKTTARKPATKKAVQKRTSASVKKTSVKKSGTKKSSVKKLTITDRTSKKHVHSAASEASSVKVINRKDVLPTLKRDPLGHLLVEQKLRASGFRGGISTDKSLLEKYSTDESIFSITPQIVLQPKDKRDVECAVRVIAAETKRFSSLSLTPRAAGTGLSGGSLTDSVVIDVCTHLTKIHEVETKGTTPTITLEPGVMWRTMDKRLKQHGLYLPPYTSSKDICSVGGSIANNAAGPDSLRYGHCGDWVESLDVVLNDGHTYTIRPITYKEYQALIKKNDAYGTILKEVFDIVSKNEAAIKTARPKTKKNSAGYAIWDVFKDGTIRDFKKGTIKMDLGRLISGSQGTIGIVTEITLRTAPIDTHTTLIAVPVFDLAMASQVVLAGLPFDPINIELFDALTFELALKNPHFFKDRLDGITYYKVLLSMYTTYHVRWGRKTPEFTFLLTLDHDTDPAPVLEAIKNAGGTKARIVTNPDENEMFWQIRRASYSLSKFQDPTKRPAAFLEDMTVPPENLGKFFVEIKKLFKKFNVHSAVHGHGGNGHFHFYPLLDFTKQGTGDMVLKMSEEFYSTAVKFKGNICGEHNDGIIRTPHLNKLFSKKILDIFKQIEHAFDPDDIFNPGKKVNPRFDVKNSLRKTN